MSTITKRRPKKYLCSIKGCDKAYNRPSLLEQHRRTHNNERPFACTDCEKKFFRQSHLRSHQWTHTNEKPILCQFCGKGVTTSQQLSRHIKTHHEDTLSKDVTFSNNSSIFDGGTDITDKCNTELFKTTSNYIPETSVSSSSPISSTPSVGKNARCSPLYKLSVPKLQPFQCPYENCGVSFDNDKELGTHMLDEHIMSDIIDDGTHRSIINETVDQASIPYDITTDLTDWSDHFCKEPMCYGFESWGSFGPLVSHYDLNHEFLPRSLLSAMEE